MKKPFEKLIHNCGFYTAPNNPEAFERELEFLLEQVVLETLEVVQTLPYDNPQDPWEYGYNQAILMVQGYVRDHWGVQDD